MKVLPLGLLNSTTSSYDKTKTTLGGNAFVKTISGSPAIGPMLTKAIDVQTDFAGLVTMSGVSHATVNNRMFVLGTFTAGVASVCLYSVNYSTGATSALGRILITLPNAAATTHTPKFIRVVDTGTTGWKIYIGTAGSVLINGGTFLVNKVDLSDFTFNPSPAQFYMGITSDAKACYQLQDPSGLGTLNNMTSIMGGAYASTLSQVILTTGTAASFVHHGFDTTLAPTVTNYPCTGATVNASPTFQMTGHTFLANDQVVITAAAPGGFTASTASAVQTVYFVRNPLANTFELSATSGGASINATSATTPTITRAFGQSTNAYLASRKTGTITSAFAGTALGIDNQKIVTMADGPNAGFLCYFFSTTSNFYCYKLTDITTGATTLPSASGINNIGTGIDIVAPANVNATYSEILGKVVYSSAAFSILMKNWANSQIFATFGSQVNTWLENTGHSSDYFRGFVVAGMDIQNGVMFITVTTTGQRVILMCDLRSDTRFDYSYIISPVTYVGDATFKFIATTEVLYNVTDTLTFSYRTAATASDAIFNSASGGWTAISTAADLSSSTLQRYVQIKANFDVATLLSGIPTQVVDFLIGYTPVSEISSNWEGSVDNTSKNGDSPAYSAFRLQTAYASSVPTLYFRAYDDSGSLVASANTASNPTFFDYSTNNGTSWLPLGTIPNTASTTEVRYKWTSPPGVRVTVSISEA